MNALRSERHKLIATAREVDGEADPGLQRVWDNFHQQRPGLALRMPKHVERAAPRAFSLGMRTLAGLATVGATAAVAAFMVRGHEPTAAADEPGAAMAQHVIDGSMHPDDFARVRVGANTARSPIEKVESELDPSPVALPEDITAIAVEEEEPPPAATRRRRSDNRRVKGPVRRPQAAPREVEDSALAKQSQLRAELSLVLRAREAVKSGQYSVALRELSEHRAEFADGELVHEVAVLRVRALCGLGRADAAKRVSDSLRRQAGAAYVEARLAGACTP